jgi:hypothetical protein
MALKYELTKPPYKDSGGRWFTLSLFHEMVRDTPIETRVAEPIFTLYEDRPGLISARKTFVEIGDPTGYKWAIQYLGDYNHWIRLMKLDWFREAYEEWIHELNQKLKAEAVARIREIAAGDTSQAISAAKFIAEEGWDKRKAGRPSKSERSAAIKAEVKAITQEDEDLKRIGLRLVKGGKG